MEVGYEVGSVADFCVVVPLGPGVDALIFCPFDLILKAISCVCC